MEQNEPFYGSETENNQVKQDDNERSAVLRKQKVGARRAIRNIGNVDQKPGMQGLSKYTQSRSRKSSNTTADKAKQAALVTTQVAAKTGKMIGEGTEAIGRGMQKGGSTLTKEGAELSSTGLGAIVGVPMMVGGGLSSAVGSGAQVVGEGIEKGSDAVDKGAGKARRGYSRAKNFRNKLKNRPKNIKDIESKGVSMVFNRTTDLLLRSAWIYALPSFGLTLIYIHIHAFLSLTLGKEYFCRLGHEWASMSLTKGVPTGGKMTALIKKQVDELGDKVGFAEWMVLGIADLILLFVFFLVASMLVFWVGVFAKMSSIFPQELIDTILNILS